MSNKEKIINKTIYVLKKYKVFHLINDKLYIKLIYAIKSKQKLNLSNPKTFNEKLNWLKLNDRKSLYTTMADKYEVKNYVSNIIGNEYVIKLLGVYNTFDEIDFNKLPSRFVIKCTHDSGGIVIVRDKEKLDIPSAKDKINKCLKKNFYYSNREWPYKNIKPRILVEEYIEDEMMDDLRDYKFMCFNGIPKFVYVTVKNDKIFENYYDINFNPVFINHGFPRNNEEFSKPKNYDTMLKIVKKLSKDIPFVRIDLHNINGKIYFGEFTFYDWAGLRPFPDKKTDYELGNYINIDILSNDDEDIK